MFKKFLFVFFISISIIIFNCSVFASGCVIPGLTYEVPEDPDYPNHKYIFVYERYMDDSGDGIFMIKLDMPIVLVDNSSSTITNLFIEFNNGLYFKYNNSNGKFEPFGGYPRSDRISCVFKNGNGELCLWDDPDVCKYGVKPLASNHNIYIDDGTLFFWTPQQNMNSPLLYRLPVTEMMGTILVVGGRTLGIVLVAFGIVLATLWVKNLVSWFLR